MERNKYYDYADRFSDIVKVSQPISAKELSERFFSAPKWIVAMMKLRNAIMKPFGLKRERNLSDLVRIESGNATTISKNDKHLDFVIMLTSENVGNDSQCISVSTKVRFNNRMGKLYFAIIKPFHNIICKTLLKRTKSNFEKQNGKKPLSEMSPKELWKLFPIILTEHKDCWADWYSDEKEQIEHSLPQSLRCHINHIGSTAIAGIWAKPTIDILLEMPETISLSELKPVIESCGYICMAETQRRIDFNKGYTPDGFAERVFHLHLRYNGDNDELYFRDYLNRFPAVAEEYECLKLKLWKQYEHNRDAYTVHKNKFVCKYTQKGKDCFRDRYKRNEHTRN